MSDPFVVALDALFASPMAQDATYTAPGGEPVSVRVIPSGPERFARFGQVQVALATTFFDVRRSEVAAPALGGIIATTAGDFIIPEGSEPISDTEGLTWTCRTEPA